jgi:rubrerythrin
MSADSVKTLLSFAVDREQEAVDFYTKLAEEATSPGMKKTFTDFANEEKGHKIRLTQALEGKFEINISEPVPDLKISDYLVDEEPRPGMSYQAALIVAMKREKAAYRFYSDLASRTQNADVKAMLLKLAQEEAKHKLKFEIEYDEVILAEN